MAERRGISGRAMARIDNTLGAPTFLLKKAVSGSDTSFTIVGNTPFKFRVIDMWIVLTATGDSTDTVRLDRNSTAMTNALDANVADKTVVRAGTIDDAQHELSVGDALKITTVNTVAADVYVLCTRI